jgi:hypothetical protein
VKMIALHREMHEPKSQPVTSGGECFGKQSEAPPTPQIPDVRQHSPGDVNRMALRQARTPRVRDSRSLGLWLTASTLSFTAPRR